MLPKDIDASLISTPEGAMKLLEKVVASKGTVNALIQGYGTHENFPFQHAERNDEGDKMIMTLSPTAGEPSSEIDNDVYNDMMSLWKGYANETKTILEQKEREVVARYHELLT